MQDNTKSEAAKKPSLMEKLAAIQLKLKAPKSQRNTFGGYNYRSAEDILEAVKPLAIENGTVVRLTDDIIEVGGRIYVKATVCLVDLDSDEAVYTTAMAREEEVKKGMDGSQITGAASSYARKYALNGMFAIDDTKDSDATNDHGKGVRPNAMSAGQIVANAAAVSPAAAKAKEAWRLYVGKPDNEGVSAATLKAHFGKVCEEVCKKQARDLTASEWDAVIEFVKGV